MNKPTDTIQYCIDTIIFLAPTINYDFYYNILSKWLQ